MRLRPVLFAIVGCGFLSIGCRRDPQAAQNASPSTPTSTATVVGGQEPWAGEPVMDPPPTESLITNAAIQTYEIPGKTWQELAANVDIFGTRPRGAASKTAYSLIWHPGGFNSSSGLWNGYASADIRVTLPHWAPTSTTPDDARQWWSYFIRQQAATQQKHVDDALKQASAATEKMRAADPQTAEAKWKEINDQLMADQRTYDTAHGGSETDLTFEPSLKIVFASEIPAALGPPKTPRNEAVPASASNKVTNAGPTFPMPLARGSSTFNYNLPLQPLEGLPFSLESKRGQVIVLNFWATWCGPCRTEEPSFEALMQQLRGENVAFLFVTAESAQIVKPFLDKMGWSIPVYTAGHLSFSNYITGYPHTLILSKSGELVMSIPGARQWDQPSMVAYLRSLIAE